jgi:hypothetical protein
MIKIPGVRYPQYASREYEIRFTSANLNATLTENETVQLSTIPNAKFQNIQWNRKIYAKWKIDSTVMHTVENIPRKETIQLVYGRSINLLLPVRWFEYHASETNLPHSCLLTSAQRHPTVHQDWVELLRLQNASQLQDWDLLAALQWELYRP